MTSIIFDREKGGVGTTTLSLHIAASLALRGWRVLFVDADPQANATLSVRLPESSGLFRLLIQDDENVLMAVPTSVYVPLHHSRSPVFDFLPGGLDTRKIERERLPSSALREALNADPHDVVIIDAAPTPGDLKGLLYAASDYAIIPTQPERLALTGLRRAAEHLANVGVQLAGIIPNMVKRQATHDKNLAALCALAPRFPVWEAVPDRADFREASQYQSMVWMLYPKRESARQIEALTDRVERLVQDGA